MAASRSWCGTRLAPLSAGAGAGRAARRSARRAFSARSSARVVESSLGEGAPSALRAARAGAETSALPKPITAATTAAMGKWIQFFIVGGPLARRERGEEERDLELLPREELE